MNEGYVERLKHQLEITAWQTTLLMNDIRGAVGCKKRVSFNKLLGRKNPVPVNASLETLDRYVLEHNTKVLGR
jgi:hypothetical protein